MEYDQHKVRTEVLHYLERTDACSADDHVQDLMARNGITKSGGIFVLQESVQSHPHRRDGHDHLYRMVKKQAKSV